LARKSFLNSNHARIWRAAKALENAGIASFSERANGDFTAGNAFLTLLCAVLRRGAARRKIFHVALPERQRVPVAA
jgi:hypothetical protein